MHFSRKRLQNVKRQQHVLLTEIMTNVKYISTEEDFTMLGVRFFLPAILSLSIFACYRVITLFIGVFWQLLYGKY